MFFSSLTTIFSLALALGVAASAPEYQEVVPGPGMPSLASLGITSKELYERPAPSDGKANSKLVARFERTCKDNGCGRVPRDDAQACANYLRNLGTQRCTVSSGSIGSNVLMCSAGKARVRGTNFRGGGPVSSYCRDVATGVQSVIDGCNWNGQVAGADAAGGNGDLIVSTEAC